MAENDLEDLLQEALADFEELKPALEASKPAEAAVNAESAPKTDATTASHGDVDKTSLVDSPAAAQPKAAPKGLGLGLGGADPLSRRPRKPTGAAASPASSASADATAGAQGSAEAAAADASTSSGKGAEGSTGKPGRKMNKEAQRLADDLIGLLQEAGLGGDTPPGPQGAEELSAALASLMGASNPEAAAGSTAGSQLKDAAAAAAAAAGPSRSGAAGEDDPLAQLFGRILGGMMPPGGAPGEDANPPPEFAAMMQQMMGMGGGPPGFAGPGAATAGTSGSSTGAAADDDDALASSRLAGLAKQTRKTVSQQAKKTRGHVEGGRAAAGAAAAGAGLFGAGGGAAGGLGAMLQELGGLGGLGGGAGGAGGEGAGVNMMVDYIMQNLLSKDVLYGPLKEIRDRYPPWLEANQSKLPPEDYRRYVAQFGSVQRVCAHYETAPSDFSKLMDLIQEMQTYGDPPGDIVEEMTGGAGRDLNSILSAAESEQSEQQPAGSQPALDELTSELDKCKVQ